ncbi:uncharacterized protein LOC129612251 isoform X2 [Condylostylus longicornis]|uniref:uncharacterized protein LOC129612251 isoform X2 n=1 Tax=Condylostylus longicornis TaxID=2530218 RepID=UPI00244D9ABC|nr:uncharacterized protein LOC129612251 isoform X2 [Condylostylus longicornis]
MPKRRANNEIQLARGRLLGILQDLAELDDDYDENDKINMPLRGRPPKRVKQDKSENATSVHESFVMKLFDRSLDLAKFQENTALYAVCRAWNINRPRANSVDCEVRNRCLEPPKREKMLELTENILKNEIGLITAMPAPKDKIDEDREVKEKKIIEDIVIVFLNTFNKRRTFESA